jgi:4a-hydroxytetrahydrobiopterin dehydratase
MSACALANRECIPCKGGIPPLKGGELTSLSGHLHEDWKVVDEHHLIRTFKLKNFREALDFTNAVGEIAEEQNHHPEITLTWGKSTVKIWTHKIDGLTDSDFVLAARVDQLAIK